MIEREPDMWHNLSQDLELEVYNYNLQTLVIPLV